MTEPWLDIIRAIIEDPDRGDDFDAALCDLMCAVTDAEMRDAAYRLADALREEAEA